MAVKKREPAAFSFQPFEGLKEIIREREIPAARKPPAEVKQPEALSDEELFSRAMAGVREIREFRDMKTGGKKTPPAVKKGRPDCDALKALEEIVSGRSAVDLSNTQEYVEWINDEFRGDLTGLLHEGRFSVKDCIDLHGLTLEEAEEEVASFLRESLRRGYKCIKIIHGRGLRSPRGPVLKETLVKRLSGRYRKHVVAFVTARQCDGGLGALYVLLK